MSAVGIIVPDPGFKPGSGGESDVVPFPQADTAKLSPKPASIRVSDEQFERSLYPVMMPPPLGIPLSQAIRMPAEASRKKESGSYPRVPGNQEEATTEGCGGNCDEKTLLLSFCCGSFRILFCWILFDRSAV
jgi:hypothetical protein